MPITNYLNAYVYLTIVLATRKLMKKKRRKENHILHSTPGLIYQNKKTVSKTEFTRPK